MVKVAICDDIEDVCLRMKSVLESYTFSDKIQVDHFCSGDTLFNNFMKKKYDLLLLDIELSDDDKENGMLISQKIKNMYPDVLIIFFSGQCGYERQLLNFEPFRFLEKPVWDDDLIAAVKSAIDRLHGWENQLLFFPFKINGITMYVEINKIILFMSQSPYVIIKCVDEEVKFRGKIDNVEKSILKMSSDFIRPSKSFLVNKHFIKRQSSKEILVITGDTITITRKYAKKINENKE